MCTIKELLEELMDDVDHAIASGIPYSEDTYVIAARAAIAKPWNAALNELRIIRYTEKEDNDGECDLTVAITWAQEARIEATIAAMKGTLLRDEESFRAVLAEMED